MEKDSPFWMPKGCQAEVDFLIVEGVFRNKYSAQIDCQKSKKLSEKYSNSVMGVFQDAEFNARCYLIEKLEKTIGAMCLECPRRVPEPEEA